MPADPLEVRLRLGFILADRHYRWQVEAVDPISRELLAMRSFPHGVIDARRFVPLPAVEAMEAITQSLLNPDPF